MKKNNKNNKLGNKSEQMAYPLDEIIPYIEIEKALRKPLNIPQSLVICWEDEGIIIKRRKK